MMPHPLHFLTRLAACLFSATILALPAVASGQVTASETLPTLHALKVAGSSIRVDGRLDEPEWQNAPVGTGFTQREPQDGSPASEQTEVKVLFGDEALIVGIRMIDSQPDQIRADLARRDRGSQSDEISIFLDTYHDSRTAFEFTVNPSGSVRDVYYFNDSHDNADESWDAVWDVKTSIDDRGWTAEFSIPFSQLRFESRNSTWGMQVGRRLQRNAETSYWSRYAKDVNTFVSSFGKLEGLEGLRSPTRLEVKPYALGSVRFRPSTAGSTYSPLRQTDFNGGLDIKYGITSDFNLDVAINPDFGQVEADPAVVNLSAFETFYPEKRPLFIEGSGLFSVGLAVGDMFYSRRIGRAPRGSADPPDGGTVEIPEVSTIIAAAKVTGKNASGLGLGVLSSLTAEESATLRDSSEQETGESIVEPLTHHFAARIEQDFDGGNHTLGAMGTAVNRRITPETEFLRSAAYVGELDGTHRWGEKAYIFRWRAAVSEVRGSTDAIDRAQRSSLHNYQRTEQTYLEYDPARTRLGGYDIFLQGGKLSGTWQYIFTALHVTPGFDISDLGFQGNSSDIDRVTGRLRFVQPRQQWIFNNYSIAMDAERSWTTNGDVIWGWIRPILFDATFKNNWYIELNPMAFGSLPSVNTSVLRGGPALREDSWHNSFGTIGTDPREALSLELFASGGGTFETRGKWYDVSPYLTIRPGNAFTMTLGMSYSWNRDPAQWVENYSATDTIWYLMAEIDQHTLSITTRLNWILTPRLSVELYAQPFVASGAYSSYKIVHDPLAKEFGERFQDVRNTENADGTQGIDIDNNGVDEFAVGTPDFSFRQLRSTLVVRYEYLPGSVIYFAWQHGREQSFSDGSFHGFRDVADVFAESSDNMLLLKISYWLSF